MLKLYFKVVEDQNILETKKIPAKWKEAEMMTLHKKKTWETLKTTGPSVYFPTCTNCSHGYYKKEGKGLWMKTNQENRLVSEKGNQLLIISKQLISG